MWNCIPSRIANMFIKINFLPAKINVDSPFLYSLLFGLMKELNVPLVLKKHLKFSAEVRKGMENSFKR